MQSSEEGRQGNLGRWESTLENTRNKIKDLSTCPVTCCRLLLPASRGVEKGKDA